MADKTGEKQPGRGAGRRFRPGESGNPRGRPRGARNHVSTLITEIFCEQAEPLARTVVTLALSGDIAALKLALERIAPKDRPVVIDLPKVKTANEITTALSVITQAVTRGELGPSEGNALAALLGEHRKVLESVEFERRLSAVEKAIGGQKG